MQTSQSHPTAAAALDHEIRALVESQPDSSSADFGDAVVEALFLGGWRISDRLIDAADPAHLLGFIERRDGRFEVMQIGIGFAWTSFDTMAQALDHLLTEGRIAAGTRATGSLSWLAALPSNSLDQL